MWCTQAPRALAIVSFACLPLVLAACASGPQGDLADCGNGIVEQGEDCDDANDKGGDGCDPSCRQEFGYGCEDEPSRCAPVCGDGFRLSAEVCDGSDLNGATCEALDLGTGVLSCDTITCELDTSGCAGAFCGNGTLDATEECDGANVGGEDCASQGYTGGTLACGSDCTFDTSGCALLTCGNGVVEGIEGCDDQNTTPEDGCGANCLVESGWQCSGQPSVCTRLCGNNVWDSGEECDGADLHGGSCLTEGFTGGTLACATTCVYDTSGCTSPVCGNSTLEAGEQCDDGNTTSGDGCSDTCQLESTCPTPLSLGTWASGDDGWTHDTSYWVRAGGYMHLDYTPGHSGSYTKPLTYATNVDLSACSSATLAFAARLSDDPGDYGSDRSEKVLVQCSGDAGANWTTLTPNPWPANQQSNCGSTGGYCAGGSGHDWSFSQTSQTIAIPAGCLTTQARFQFLATGSTTWSLNAPGWYVYPVTIN